MSQTMSAQAISARVTSGRLARKPAPLTGEATTKPAPTGFRAYFKAALESLVAAQSRRFPDTEPLPYRFPPL